MNTPVAAQPDQRSDHAAHYLVRAAIAAPSVHNTQPWYFVRLRDGMELHADLSRRLPATDATGREMVISCGAALFNLRLAMRHLGFRPIIGLLPDPARPSLLARLRWGPYGGAVPDENALYRALWRRHTHRGPFVYEPVPYGLIDRLTGEARRERAELFAVTDPYHHELLADAIHDAEIFQQAHLGFATDRAYWTPPPGSARRDGVPAALCPRLPDDVEFAARDFALGAWRGLRLGPRHAGAHSLGRVALLSTHGDGRLDWLLAGQALQRILLTATVHGVSAAFHTQPLELPDLRERIRTKVVAGAYPQLILRFGHAGRSLPSPRRPVEETLLIGSEEGPPS